MSFPAPLPVSPVGNNTNQDPGLRAYQRVTAQVLSVTGTTVILEVDGHAIVAQLTSADQASALAAQRTAQFLVTQQTEQVITLKFIRNDQAEPAPGPVSGGVDLAARLLEQNNLPATVSTLMAARSMLKQHLPVTAETLDELLGALSAGGTWDETKADLAAVMKSAGLPVTAQSLALASRPPVQTAEALSRLLASLKQARSQGLTEEALQLLQSSLRGLDALVIQGDGESSGLAGQLQAAVKLLGRSLESLLLDQIQNPASAIHGNDLLSLAALQHTLERCGAHEAARAIAEFLDDMRLNQFMNAKPESPPRLGEWSELGFALQKTHDVFTTARLRIAREADERGSRINPACTRLILQVELRPGEAVEVDLSLAGRQVRTSVTAPDPDWCKQAENELSTLAEALSELGYVLKDAHVDVGAPQPFSRIQAAPGGVPLMTVNIEV